MILFLCGISFVDEADEPLAGSELIVTVWTWQHALVQVFEACLLRLSLLYALFGNEVFYLLNILR